MKRQEFLALQAHWYKKLKREGFKDIESFAPDGKPYDLMITWPNKPPELAELDAEYFRAASHFLHEFNFKTTLDKYIWSFYCEGYSCGEISKKIKSLPFNKAYQKHLKKGAIWLRIQKLDKHLKEWVHGNREIRVEVHRESAGGGSRRRPTRDRRKTTTSPFGEREDCSSNSSARDRQIAKAFTEQLLRHRRGQAVERLHSFAFAITQRQDFPRVNESVGF